MINLNFMKTKAIIFDLDGIITDTERYHYLSWQRVAQSRGLHLTEKEHASLKGRSREDCLDLILHINGAEGMFDDREKALLCKEKNEIYLEYIDSLTADNIMPGVKELIKDAKQKGLKLAVASVSKNASRVLRALKLWDMFDYVADVTKVSRPKPDPEIFSVCAQKLGVEPRLCVGIEDSQAGIEAIFYAGMRSVGVGVQVVSRRPDIELSSTVELSLDIIIQ